MLSEIVNNALVPSSSRGREFENSAAGKPIKAQVGSAVVCGPIKIARLVERHMGVGVPYISRVTSETVDCF